VSAQLEATRGALAGARAWLVGGAVRDRILDRQTEDLDVVVEGDVAAAARRVAQALGAHAFALSDAHGAWRVVARDHSWQLDLLPLAGRKIEDDLAQRDLTVNASGHGPSRVVAQQDRSRPQ